MDFRLNPIIDGDEAGETLVFVQGWPDDASLWESQIEALSQTGLLSRFVGMVTDSRSFLSFTRHEYFRRILCNILGDVGCFDISRT